VGKTLSTSEYNRPFRNLLLHETNTGNTDNQLLSGLSLCLASRYQVLYARNNGLKITKLQKFFALTTLYHMIEISSTFNTQS